jgi:hypothetical protein
MPPQGRKTGARPGDATGREKERREKEVRPAIEEAATQVTLTSGPRVEHTDEVIDYSGGGSPSAEEAVAGVRMLSMDEALASGDTAHTVDDLPESALDQGVIDALPDGRTDTRPETIVRTEEPQPAAQFPQQPQPRQHAEVTRQQAPVVEQAFRIMRVNTDLPDVTIGKDNHFTFRENQRYKVPQYVYDHLDEKGYVYH